MLYVKIVFLHNFTVSPMQVSMPLVRASIFAQEINTNAATPT